MPEEYSGYPTGYPYGTNTPSTPGYGSTPPTQGYGNTPSAPGYNQGAVPPPATNMPYYPYPTTPSTSPKTGAMPPSAAVPPSAATPGGGPGAISPAGTLPLPYQEQSYIENILRLNKDKEVTAYMTFEHAGGNESKAFTGNIEAAGRDHLILKDPGTGTRYLLPLIYLDYVVFQGKVNYAYPYRR